MSSPVVLVTICSARGWADMRFTLPAFRRARSSLRRADFFMARVYRHGVTP